jgi:hypothetical protein
VIPADIDFLQALRALTARGILLIVDEVQTGVGRTGKLFAHEHAAIEPDIMTLGKGIGGGVPLAALLAREAICCFVPGDQGGTYNGNPLMTAVGVAVMQRMLSPGFLAEVTSRGQYQPAPARLSARHGLAGERARPAARADPRRRARPGDRSEGAGADAVRPAAQFAASQPAALHAGAECQRGGNRPDDRPARRPARPIGTLAGEEPAGASLSG